MHQIYKLSSFLCLKTQECVIGLQSGTDVHIIYILKIYSV